MMIEIPDFPGIEKRVVFVFFGMDCRAIKYPGLPWKVKTKTCVQCGKCCQDISQDSVFPPVTNGVCANLVTVGTEVRCGLGVHRPLNCAVSDTTKEFCSVEYKEI